MSTTTKALDINKHPFCLIYGIPSLRVDNDKALTPRFCRTAVNVLLSAFASQQDLPRQTVYSLAYLMFQAKTGFDVYGTKAQGVVRGLITNKASYISVLEAAGKLNQFYRFVVNEISKDTKVQMLPTAPAAKATATRRAGFKHAGSKPARSKPSRPKLRISASSGSMGHRRQKSTAQATSRRKHAQRQRQLA